ncbi:Pyridoxal kinase [Neorhizobium galegae bv. officinalis bv. officinalis str. HAMBI 1141]|jgi:pyridoxine kinase|uniref:pyridoxal kinase n=1 Tax=Neorhizobium galegae bv. officinalis bv. officinalis str. HAMBI 1141 TaxID=1028801 RepID=A0A068TE18_NEOGA|nr:MULTISPECIES: pyridoxal kinase PdxY [Neorhizobium]MCJ9669152.1 pyridoxal kinase PdxY [Neorhizobium sp. SHOUNA12B]MCJ9744420.1 pyridoxal kinase PdxY [Neorhizobium sp. SHOUNA12A]MCJ9749486.1 pyridoxal kinase PdxY [Neorhizobium sp. BETTINA12A]CDN56281.1 Pyridoxal kinase [Neorhizobium galegae bv. officinalis bv. officinalis str. HAMBI 1141]
MQDTSSAVLVISSHVVRGSVGNRAAVFALETLGFPVWAMPTVVLPWHPGHGPSTRLTFPESDFDKAIDDLIRAPWLGEVKAVLTGYFGNAAQPRSVARLIRALKEKNPDLLYVCDPVMGDLGGLYIPQPTAEAIRDELIPLATIATPNRYELAWLSGAPLETNNDIMDAAIALGPPRILVTSAVPMMAGGTGNLYLTGKHALLAEHRLIDNPPNGLGDLLGALFLGRILAGMDEEKALQLATASVFEVLARTAKRGGDELTLETDASSLSTPMAMVQMRRLVHPLQRTKR